ncbi:MAG TPA: TIGR04282 family arsenosugar biosynthesis glycosyltransferase [Chthoniobacterales bacterium]
MRSAHRILDPALPPRTELDGLCALAVMTKAPRPGEVKTRLTPPLRPAEAAELNRCFLRDTTAAIAQASGNIARGVAVYTPKGAEADYTDILPGSFALLLQRGGSFGERLTAAAYDLFRVGFDSVCLIDSDSPTVAPECYSRAADLLAIKGERVVLGPSDDGGYYLIGLKKLRRRLFEQIDWSTARVLEQTAQRAEALDLPVELLPSGYDVDDARTLRRLCNELLRETAGSTINVAPHTRQFLSGLVAQRQF